MSSKKRPPPVTASREAAKHRRKVYAEAYLSNGGNKTEAALAAGFSPATAAQQGSRLFKHAEIQQLIQQARTRVETKAELSLDDLARSLRQALTFDPRTLFNPDGTLRPIHELDADTAMALTGLEVVETFAGTGAKRKVIARVGKVKWIDRNSARDQLARVLGAYEKDNRQRTDPLTLLLKELMKTPGNFKPVADAHEARR